MSLESLMGIREEIGGHPLLSSPFGEHNYLPRNLASEIRVKYIQVEGSKVSLLKVPDYKVQGEEAELTGDEVFILIQERYRRELEAWWVKKGGNCFEELPPFLTVLQMTKYMEAMEAGIPPFLANHYAMHCGRRLYFGERYKGAVHCAIMGHPDAGKTLLSTQIARKVPSAERWSIDTKYTDYAQHLIETDSYADLSWNNVLGKAVMKCLEVDRRSSLSDFLDKTLMEMAMASNLDGKVDYCIWDTPGVPRVIWGEEVRAVRPTDLLDVMVHLGGWTKRFFLSRELELAQEEKRVEYFLKLMGED